jgi:transposase-like protein
MQQDTVIALPNPWSTLSDPLTEVLRRGAQQLLAQAVEAEVATLLAQYADRRDAQGRKAVVRNGYLPAREVQTGLGAVPVQVPRVRDRSGSGLQFHSTILPPYLRRSKSLETLLPWLYLKGISTGDFSEALESLLGPHAAGLSPATISRLKQVWQDELDAWQGRELSDKRYVYFWVDAVHFEARLETAHQCILVIMGATVKGAKELVGLWDGYAESEQSWKELLLDLKSRGLQHGPVLAIGDGALGFWKALPQAYGQTRRQRCWVHKTANVLDKLPKDMQPQAKQRLQAIWMAPDRARAEMAFDLFVATYEQKYPQAVECLAKDREVLLTFYAFPAEHWVHIRTTNPIESTFSTVRLRTDKTRGCLSRQTALTMVFKLCQSAQKRWHRLNGAQHMIDVLEGAEFQDGIRVESEAA